jgi:hypothetical protein
LAKDGLRIWGESSAIADPGMGSASYRWISLPVTAGRAGRTVAARFGTADERASTTCAKVLAAKKLAYRYMWFADQFTEDPLSPGISKGGARPVGTTSW